MMAKIQLGLVLLLCAAGSAAGQKAHNIWEEPLRHGIAAKVEDRIITFEELRMEMAPLISRVRNDSRSPAEFVQKMSELYLEVLRNLVDRILIVKAFKEKKYNIPASYLENEYERVIIEDFSNDRTKFIQHLRSQGKSVREFRKDLRERIIVSVMRNEMRKSQSEISPEKIANFYSENKIHFYQEESVRLRLIMLKPIADESLDLLRQNAAGIIARLEEGADFAELAKKHSQGARADRGGDWGWIQRSDIREELSEVAFSLRPDQFSKAIELDGQIFILYVEDYRGEGIQPIQEVRDNIENILVSQLERQAQKEWLERLRKDAYIKYY